MKVLSLLLTATIILGLNISSSYAQEGFIQPPQPMPPQGQEQAQTQGPRCLPRSLIVQSLKSYRSQQAQKAVMYVDKETIIELFVNEETGRWTLFATTVDGKSCFIASGSIHQFKKSVLPGQPS